MNEELILKKIVEKKEFSELPEEDIKRIFNKFNKPTYLDEEKVKLTRDLLRKVYSVFLSKKLFNSKDKNKDFKWFLKKHISTRERFGCYNEIYERLLKNSNGKISVYDFGCGVNGFSYSYFKQTKKEVSYIGVEALKQLVTLQNDYFMKNKFNAIVFHSTLFNIGNLKQILNLGKGFKILFLFKIVDSLEMVERNFSKKLILELIPFVDIVVVSFAKKSLISKKNFRVSRSWFFSFVNENFKIVDEFEMAGEQYLSFKKR